MGVGWLQIIVLYLLCLILQPVIELQKALEDRKGIYFYPDLFI